MADGMVEWQELLWYGGMIKWRECWNGGQNGGMVAKWQDGRMAGTATYPLFYGTHQQHHDIDDNDTL